jgi:hypothetical protein
LVDSHPQAAIVHASALAGGDEVDQNALAFGLQAQAQVAQTAKAQRQLANCDAADDALQVRHALTALGLDAAVGVVAAPGALR